MILGWPPALLASPYLTGLLLFERYGVLGYTRSAVFLTLYRVVLVPSYIGEGLAHEQGHLGVNVPVTEC